MDVDTVKQGTRQPSLIAPDRTIRAGAGTFRIPGKPARAWVHRRHEGHPCRKCGGPCRPRNCHYPILKGLAQCFKRVGAELRQLIQEKHAPVGKREFARSRRRTSTDKTGMTDGVMGRAKGSASHQRFVGRQLSGNRVDLGYLKSSVPSRV